MLKNKRAFTKGETSKTDGIDNSKSVNGNNRSKTKKGKSFFQKSQEKSFLSEYVKPSRLQ